jgi:hypothetical protein
MVISPARAASVLGLLFRASRLGASTLRPEERTGRPVLAVPTTGEVEPERAATAARAAIPSMFLDGPTRIFVCVERAN